MVMVIITFLINPEDSRVNSNTFEMEEQMSLSPSYPVCVSIGSDNATWNLLPPKRKSHEVLCETTEANDQAGEPMRTAIERLGRNGDGSGEAGVEASGRKFEGRRGDGVRGYWKY